METKSLTIGNWERNGKQDFVLRNEKGRICGFAYYDETYFSNNYVVAIQVIGKRRIRKHFNNKEEAEKWLFDWMRKHLNGR